MKMIIVFVYIILFIGCGQRDVLSSISPQEAIDELEKSGEIPKLDRTSSIKGIDLNNDGIRDDIENYIENSPVTKTQKKGIRQLAKSLQNSLLIDKDDKKSLTEASYKISRSVQCMSLRFPDIQERSEILTSIESKTANTKERTIEYIKFNNALSGTTSKLLSGDTCDE